MYFSDLSWSIRGTLDFTLGDPDIPTPEGICEDAIIDFSQFPV